MQRMEGKWDGSWLVPSLITHAPLPRLLIKKGLVTHTFKGQISGLIITCLGEAVVSMTP